jgi:hypothetical protein
MRWIYGAYKLQGGDKTQDEFASYFAEFTLPYQEVFMIEDKSDSYKDGWGVVGLVYCYYNGWRMEPEVEWFPWARKRNILRSTVAFLLYCRYSKDIGVVLVHATDDDNHFFKGVKKYVTLYPVRAIPGGLPTGNDNLFYLRGKKRGTS